MRKSERSFSNHALNVKRPVTLLIPSYTGWLQASSFLYDRWRLAPSGEVLRGKLDAKSGIGAKQVTPNVIQRSRQVLGA
jgi:hypothetical protein